MKIFLKEQNWYMKISSYWDETEVNEEEYNKITSWQYNITKDNWEFIFTENPEWIEINKAQKLDELKIIEKEAVKERLRYLTLDMMDEGIFKTNKQNELDIKGQEIKSRYMDKINEMTAEFWETILDEI